MPTADDHYIIVILKDEYARENDTVRQIDRQTETL